MNYKVGDLVRIEKGTFNSVETQNINNYFGGEWIFGKPMRIDRIQGSGLFCAIEHEGQQYSPYFEDRDVTLYITPEKIKDDLLKMREELGV